MVETYEKSVHDVPAISRVVERDFHFRSPARDLHSTAKVRTVRFGLPSLLPSLVQQNATVSRESLNSRYVRAKRTKLDSDQNGCHQPLQWHFAKPPANPNNETRTPIQTVSISVWNLANF